MRVTALGKIIILLLILGGAVGGWRFFQSKGGANGKGTNGNGGTSVFTNPFGNKNPSGGNGKSSTGNDGGNTQNAGTGGDVAASDNEVLLVTSASKKGWLLDQIQKFNSSNGDKYRITTKFLETRMAMHAILEGKVKPALWSPSSSIWTSRLAQAWRDKNSTAILNIDDSSSYRVFFRSPLVFLTTKQKAKYLRPILSGGWDKFIAANNKPAPWGKLKWSHSDPLSSNSGMMTLGLVLARYTGQTNTDPNDAATSQSFISYMQNVSRGLVYDLPAQGGTGALTRAFLEDTKRYDFITTYESSAIDAAQSNSNLVVIYPNPTAVSESVGAVLNGPWLSDKQREGARAFLQFLGTEQAMREGLAYHFRPAQSGGNLTLSNTLSRLRGQGFQQSFSAVELPPYQALNDAAFQWHNYVAKKPVQ